MIEENFATFAFNAFKDLTPETAGIAVPSEKVSAETANNKF